MISEIKKYIDENKFISLAALSYYFKIEVPAMEKMMELLIQKNYVKKIDGSHRPCAGCLSKCSQPQEMIYYEKIM
jgi:hypothetical protein